MGGFNPLQWGSDPTQLNPPAPDPTQNQPANSSSFGAPVTTDMGSFAGGPPAGTQDQGQPPNQWQSVPQAPPNLPLEQPGGQGQQLGPQFQDPLGPMLNDLVQKHQQLMAAQQPPSNGSPVKNTLRRFFQGAGDALLVQSGLPTPNFQRLQLEQQIASISNARSLYLDRQAEVASRQAQLQMMGTPLTPQLAQSIGHPELAGQVIPPTLAPVISAEDRGREAAQINAQQRQDALDQNRITLPPTQITKAAATAAGYPELEGKTLRTPQDYAVFEHLAQARGLQKFDTGRDGTGPDHGIWMMDRVGNPVQQMSTISESKRALQAMAPPKEPKDSTKPVIGFDTDGNQVLTNGANASLLGLSEIREVGQAEAEKVTNARSLLPVFNNPNPNDRGLIQLAQDLNRQGKLGPIASRYQEFMAGTYGQGDPEVEELRTKMGLSTTGLMQVHVGARGSAQMLEHFEDLANAKKMDGPTLLSGLNAENNYIMRKAMIPKNSRFQQGVGNTGVGNPQGRAVRDSTNKIIGYTNDGKTMTPAP